MPIRLSGINSGLDTDALIKELVSAYSLKTEKYEKQKTKIEWKKEAWQTLNTKIYGLYTSIANLRFDNAYNLKKTNVSDSTKATVTASSTAVTGTQKLNILQTAQASYITGGKLGDDVTASSTLGDLGYTGAETSIEVRKNDGSVHEIKVSKDTKISELVSQMKDAGLNASFDENNKRFFVSAKESGAANDFSLCSTDGDSDNILSLIGLDSSLVELDANGNKVFSSAGGAYKEALALKEAAGDQGIATYLKELVAGYKDQIAAQQEIKDASEATIKEYDALVKHRDARQAHNDMYKAMKDEGLDFDSPSLQKMVKSLYANGKEITEESVENYLKENNIELPEGKTAADVAKVLNANQDNMKKVAQYEGSVLTKSLADLNTEVENGKAAYEQAQSDLAAANSAIAEIKSSKYAELIELDETALQAKIGAYEETADKAEELLANESVESKGGAIKVVGQDAVIVLNGVEFTSETNSFSINGLTIETHAVTGEGNDNAISITTSTDTQGIYDKVKDFLKQYNEVINEISKLYNADAAKGYEPLTDEERDAMSETEIEKWEEKIKNALLRRDTTLGSLMNAMTNSMAQAYEVNGKKLSLSSFGIATLGYFNSGENEKYAFHIDGNKDDEKTSGKEDKLMKAIQENPEDIIDFLKQLTSNLYTTIDGRMKSTELSSVYKVYNDKEIDKEIKNMEDLIEKWKEKVEAEEDRYYKQFSNMEVALSKLQSQTNSLTGLLGQ